MLKAMIKLSDITPSSYEWAVEYMHFSMLSELYLVAFHFKMWEAANKRWWHIRPIWNKKCHKKLIALLMEFPPFERAVLGIEE